MTGLLYDRERFAHCFLSCSVDGKIKMWDIRIPNSVVTFYEHDLDVTSFVFMNPYYNIASGSHDKTIKVVFVGGF